MGSGSYVLLVNIALATFVAAGFLFAYLHDRRRKQALAWLIGALTAGMAGTIEAIIPFMSNDAALAFVTFALFLLTMLFITAGIHYQYGKAVPWSSVAALYACSILFNLLAQNTDRGSLINLASNEFPNFLMIMIGLRVIVTLEHKKPLDYLFMIVVFLFGTQFLILPGVAKLLGGTGASASQYLSTSYAVFEQTLLAILAMALVTLMALMLVRDVISSLVKVSVTDPLSGLLNRRGFLDRAKGFIESSRSSRQGVFLAIADIDHFKAINDKYGHETGDRVIQAFGDLLGTLSKAGTSVARIGGEEFAVLFASPNEAVARLYCESVRTSAEVGAADTNRDLPRFTVSFGLAGLMPGESLESLTRRADLALYSAKQDGRNRVAVAVTGSGKLAEKSKAA